MPVQRRPAIALVIATVAVFGQGLTAQASTLIATLAAETPVRAWAGIGVLSIRSDGGYRLATQQGTEAPRLLPDIAAAPHPFDANIGPGPNGAPVIVFVRCASTHRCGLMRTTLAGNIEVSIGAPAAVGNHDHAPAVWGNRLAFARPAKHGSDWVYVVALGGGGRVPAVRLRSDPQVPTCYLMRGSNCFATRLRPAVTELSLRGSALAEDVELGSVETNECPRTEVRLVDVANRRSERIKSPFCGIEGGQKLLGISLTATHLLYTMECPGDPEVCEHTKTLVYRYGLRDHRTAAAPEHDLLTGFAALDDDHAIEVSAPEVGEEDCARHEPNSKAHPLCQLVLVGPIRFKHFHF